MSSTCYADRYSYQQELDFRNEIRIQRRMWVGQQRMLRMNFRRWNQTYNWNSMYNWNSYSQFKRYPYNTSAHYYTPYYPYGPIYVK